MKSGGKLDRKLAVDLGNFHNIGTLAMSTELVAKRRKTLHYLLSKA